MTDSVAAEFFGDETTPTLAELTTLKVGGKPHAYTSVDHESEIVEAVREVDSAGEPLLVLGGGSNVVVADQGFPGTVLRDARSDIRVVDDSACGGTTLRVSAGTTWDELVAYTIAQHLVGLEALSGIPGSSGAAPVQNIGAYGREVAENLATVRAYDRLSGEIRTIPRAALKLGYRDSLLKQSFSEPDVGGGRTWGPTGRWIVLEIELQLQEGELSAPVRYRELANRLEIEVGERADIRDVRRAVLELRRSKGMVLSLDDHDTWSAGSFFTNPILTEKQAGELLPEGAPRFAVEDRSMVAVANPNSAAPKVPGVVKTSAAWLINHAGFEKGWRVAPGAPASLSTKHVLALTNRGGANTSDIVELARAVHDGVLERFGIELVPEPVLVGVEM